MIPVSIVIITLNEEKNIKRCLDSVIDISDDILIIDSDSKDKTVEICKQYKNVKVISNKFIDYSSQRNFGTESAKYDYILNIDADEVLSEKLKKSILSLNIDNNKNIIYSFNRLNHYCLRPIKFGAWYPDVKRKFWNKNYAKWEGNVHETLKFKDKPQEIKLKGDLLHYTYDNPEEHFNRTIKYAILSAEKDFINGKKSNILKLIFKPFLKFIFLFFFKLGFLDGYYGYLIAKTSAFSDFIRISVLISKNKKIVEKK